MITRDARCTRDVNPYPANMENMVSFNNASKWQMGFNSAFKGLNSGVPWKKRCSTRIIKSFYWRIGLEFKEGTSGMGRSLLSEIYWYETLTL